MKKFLLISVCKEDMHELEFVKPIITILEETNLNFEVKKYTEEINLKNYSHIIICGTSLKDNNFLSHLEYFSWIKEFTGKILGICAGMQIIGLIFGCEIISRKEIGFYFENFNKKFLGIDGEIEVYHLHNNYIKPNENFDSFFCNSEIVQAIKHKNKEIYGVLFHPEVRNKEIIMRFLDG